ncbi:MAG TPA: DinB family protein [Ktedonobacteraceae bacterium]
MNNATTLLREQIQQAHGFLNTVMEGVTSEQAQWVPPGTANPLAATYVHAIASEDLAINVVLKGDAPLYATTWAGKTGISDVQPLTTAEWARHVQVDLPTAQNYARAVHEATDAYLATLMDDDLSRVLDLTSFGLGQMTIGTLLNRMVLGHIDNMCGEIAVLKGLQGAKGYPM